MSGLYVGVNYFVEFVQYLILSYLLFVIYIYTMHATRLGRHLLCGLLKESLLAMSSSALVTSHAWCFLFFLSHELTKKKSYKEKIILLFILSMLNIESFLFVFVDRPVKYGVSYGAHPQCQRGD